MKNNPDIITVVLGSAQVALVVLLCLASLYGLLLLIKPDLGLRLNRLLSRSFSTRKLSQPLDRQFHVERYFYHHAKLYGLVIIGGSVYLLYRLFFDFPLLEYAAALPDMLPNNAWEWLLDAARIFLTLMTVFTLYVGLVVFIRPSQIKGVEQHTNRWISTRQKLAFFSRSVPVVDSAAERAPRVFGGIVFLLGLSLFLVLV